VSDESNALMALKNAWNGAVSTADEIRDLSTAVQAVPDDADLASLDFERYHRVALAHANSAEALRGVIEQIRRKHGQTAA
jgi:hypothetical protein